MARTVIRTVHFEPRVDLNNQIVSLFFSDQEGNEADVWLGQGDLFVILDGIQKMIEANPQMKDWQPTAQNHLSEPGPY